MDMGRAGRYWHTLRHLRPGQFYRRAWFRLARPRPDLRDAPSWREGAVGWRPCARRPSLVGPDAFDFLGRVRRVAGAADWGTGAPRLWLYNAHYFDDLVAGQAPAREAWHRALIQRWIVENPPGSAPGWEPYPVSLRLVNWAKWLLAGPTPIPDMLHSLAVQARWLRRRLEFHLLGNHLWANAKALVFAGTVFEGPEADAWRRAGLALVERELREQLLADGGHFERSPMYHAIVLEDLLDLVQLAAARPAAFAADDARRWSAVAAGMLRWLRVMTHPDGGIAFFNDAAFDIAPETGELEEYAATLGVAVDDSPLASVEALDASGYVRLALADAVVIADVAAVGPDYLPGHAHADTLSFELSLRGRRVLVNGGTSTYEEGSERQRERGTPMHNTVVIDGADSSDVWASFRVGRRARPFDVRHGVAADGPWLEAAHDGYRHRPGATVHRRRWQLRADGLSIEDRIEGGFTEAHARFRFVPTAAVESTSPSSGRAAVEGAALSWSVSAGAVASVESGSWHPRFGASEGCTVVDVRLGGPDVTTRFEWA